MTKTFMEAATEKQIMGYNKEGTAAAPCIKLSDLEDLIQGLHSPYVVVPREVPLTPLQKRLQDEIAFVGDYALHPDSTDEDITRVYGLLLYIGDCLAKYRHLLSRCRDGILWAARDSIVDDKSVRVMTPENMIILVEEINALLSTEDTGHD